MAEEENFFACFKVGDNCILCVAVKLKFPSIHTSPSEKFECGSIHSNTLLQFPLKQECMKPRIIQ